VHSLGRKLAPALDAACFALFVALGRDQHGLHGGVGWFFTVVWPLLLGWFVAALATRLYLSEGWNWSRLGATLVIAVLLGGVARGVFTDRTAFSTFTIVELCFIGLFTFGWRGIAVLVERRARPRTTP
jgi:Protein of unknown function (DUF3054)